MSTQNDSSINRGICSPEKVRLLQGIEVGHPSPVHPTPSLPFSSRSVGPRTLKQMIFFSRHIDLVTRKLFIFITLKTDFLDQSIENNNNNSNILVAF